MGWWRESWAEEVGEGEGVEKLEVEEDWAGRAEVRKRSESAVYRPSQ